MDRDNEPIEIGKGITVKTKHTPGPWLIGDMQGDCLYIEGPNRAAPGRRDDSPTICDLFEDVTPEDSVTMGVWLKPYENSEANARLIASAPEMLEALEGIILWARKQKTVPVPPEQWIKILDLIAKAKGGNNAH